TIDNAPNNGAFLDFGKLKSEVSRGLTLYSIKVPGKEAVAGTVGIRQKSDQKYEVSRLSVHPKWQGLGFGAGLLRLAEKHIKEHYHQGEKALQGPSKDDVLVELGCIAEDESLIRFYVENGFSISGIKTFKKLPHGVCFMKKKVTL
ncbi:GNAT family N-acetyltransferase, partial [Aduncisulcus paluster]